MLEEWWKRRNFITSQISFQIERTLHISEMMANLHKQEPKKEVFEQIHSAKLNMVDDLYIVREQMKAKYRKWKDRNLLKEEFYRQRISQISAALLKIKEISKW